MPLPCQRRPHLADWVIPLKAGYRNRSSPMENHISPCCLGHGGGNSQEIYGFYKQTRGFPQPPRTKSRMIGTQKVFTSTWSWTCAKNINPTKKCKMENVVHFMDNLIYLIYPFLAVFVWTMTLPTQQRDGLLTKRPTSRPGRAKAVWSPRLGPWIIGKKSGRSHEQVCSLAFWLNCFLHVYFTIYYYYASKI